MVEGYTDVISMHQSGIENVVASSGTSLTESQIKLVRKFTENLTIIYDGDFAGIKASLRGIDMVLSEGMNVKIVLLPEGEDPDSFSKKLKFDDFQKYIDENEQDFIKFKTKLLLEDAQNDPVKRAGVISDIVKSISVINDSILRAEYIKECSSIIKIREEDLYSEVANKISDKFGKQVGYQPDRKQAIKQNFAVKQSKSSYDPIEKEIIYYLLNFGTFSICINHETKEKQSVAEYITSQIIHEELEFTNNIYNIIFDDCAKLIAQNKKVDSAYFALHQDPEVSNVISDIISPEPELSRIWTKNGASPENIENKIETNVPLIIDKFKLKNIQFRIESLLQEIKNIEPGDNSGKLLELLNTLKPLDDYKKALTEHTEKSALL
jgi:DNA primase